MKHEIRMENYEGMMFLIRASSLVRHSPFGFRHFVHSAFVIRHFPFVITMVARQ
jgi:hypothetical protein